MPIVNLKPAIREIGRIRMGEKAPNGAPRRLDKFRLTSPDRIVLEHAARLYGGEVRPWVAQPGQFELYVETDELPCMVAPMEVSQWYEQWSAGGCTHRCDGVCETIKDRPCECDPEERKCKTTTRMSVYLPDLPGLGVWRIETHGWYAATELPQAAEMLIQLARSGQYPDAALAIEQREVKREGKSKKFPVPVLRIRQALRQLMTGEIIDTPALPDARPALPSGEPETPARVQQAVKGNERGSYAEQTGARPQPPRQPAPTASPKGREVIEPEIVDDDRQARTNYATQFSQDASELGWENKTRRAFLRQTLNQPELTAMDAITVPQWATISGLMAEALSDRFDCLELWGECCSLWDADSTDPISRDEWFAKAIDLPAPQPLTVYLPAQWAALKNALVAAKALATGDAPEGDEDAAIDAACGFSPANESLFEGE